MVAQSIRHLSHECQVNYLEWVDRDNYECTAWCLVRGRCRNHANCCRERETAARMKQSTVSVLYCDIQRTETNVRHAGGGKGTE